LKRSHYWVSGILGVALVPALRWLHLPARFDLVTLGTAYWLVLAAQSIFAAAILYLIGMPRQDTLQPLLECYRRSPIRIVLLLFYFGILGWAFTWVKALILTVDTAALLELREQRKPQSLGTAAVLIPALYFFTGFLLVLAYNCIIVSLRFNFAFDAAFKTIDTWLLLGGSVSNLSHWAVAHFPVSFFRFLEFIYFGMFPQIGAGIILVALSDGKARALQFVGTILMAYYIALGLFYLWPSQGPYYLCPGHFSRFPSSLRAYAIEKFLIAHALALWNHVPISRISTDYFIAFPCMHVTQPLIVLWFLRRWKRMVIILAAYDVLLVASILLLEWHYVVDLIGGVVVAGIAIAIAEGWVRFRTRTTPLREHVPSLP
jgi:hypothetical protein